MVRRTGLTVAVLIVGALAIGMLASIGSAGTRINPMPEVTITIVSARANLRSRSGDRKTNGDSQSMGNNER